MRTHELTYALTKRTISAAVSTGFTIGILPIVNRPRGNWFMPVTRGGVGEI